MKNENSAYRCSDFHIACLLKYFGFQLLSIKKEDGKTVWEFQRTPNLDKTLQAYWQAKLTVNLVDFINSQKFIKASIYN